MVNYYKTADEAWKERRNDREKVQYVAGKGFHIVRGPNKPKSNGVVMGKASKYLK
jgi:hypothetical protein